MKSERDVWFPTKRYGWGWGPPLKWQGWAVLALFAAAVAAIVIGFPPATNPLEFWILLCLACAILVVVCWWKGEQPRWRWGEREP